MTTRQIKRRYIWATVLGLASGSGLPLLLASEGSDQVAQTFWGAAEKFGVYAAVNMALIAVLVFMLYCQTTYNQNRMEQVVDDNTLAFNRFASQMRKRPCQNDSDIDRIVEKTDEEDSGDDAIVKRVKERHAARQSRMKPKAT